MEPLLYNPHLSGWWGAAVQSSVGIPHVVGGAMVVDAVMSMVGVGLGDAVVEAVCFPAEGKPPSERCSLAATPLRLTHRSHGRGRIALKKSV